jgi:membrane fusion protein (multidrug efflux system)
MEEKKQGNVFFIFLAVILLVVIVFAGVKIFKIVNFKFSPPKQVATLKIDAVGKKELSLSFDFVGRSEASKQVEIRSRVNGILEKRFYQEGLEVETGDRLFKIEEGKFAATVDSSKAEVKKQKANFERLTKEKQRFDKLIKTNAVSQKEYDDVLFSFKQAEANLLIAEANLKNALLDLEYTNINSTIDGITSKALKFEGNYIDANKDGALTYVFQINPIFIRFNLSESEYLELRKNVSNNSTTNIENKTSVKLEIALSDGKKFDYDGRIIFSDPQINQQTGLIEARAEFSNPKNQILPGQFVNFKVKGVKIKNGLVIPLKSIVTIGDEKENSDKNVYILDEKNNPILTKIKIGYIAKDLVQVVSGLKAGDKIVIEGQNKIKPGAEIKILNLEEKSENKENTVSKRIETISPQSKIVFIDKIKEGSSALVE